RTAWASAVAAHLESPLVHGLDVGDGRRVDAGARRTLRHPGEHVVDLVVGALHLGLHATVAEVAHPARRAGLAGDQLHRVPVADALDVARDENVHAPHPSILPATRIAGQDAGMRAV